MINSCLEKLRRTMAEKKKKKFAHILLLWTMLYFNHHILKLNESRTINAHGPLIILNRCAERLTHATGAETPGSNHAPRLKIQNISDIRTPVFYHTTLHYIPEK